MPPLFEIEHLFCAPSGYLAEIRRLDRDPAAPKSDIYQWLWIEDGAVQALRFVAMARDQVERRIFREAQLQFDDNRGELCWTGSEPIALTPLLSRSLPAPLTQLVNLHLT
ncbi:hypothetical protein O4H66_14620 [Comamonadaceae bacterium G21597-S1]|nr:hypothetical protein [Comamonadaceae bacterium G21597-S1]